LTAKTGDLSVLVERLKIRLFSLTGITKASILDKQSIAYQIAFCFQIFAK
jgi:hypothetical protein